MEVSFLIKLQGFRFATSIKKKRLCHKCFPVNFARFLIKSFLQNICQRLLLLTLSFLILYPTSTQTLINNASSSVMKKYQRSYWYSPFRLTSLIYAEKFEFENPAIIEDKQCKQTERFSVIAKESDYFLSLDDKSK